VGAGTASADTTSFLLTHSNVGPTLATGYVRVDVNLVDSNTATITFTALYPGGLLIDGSLMGLNVNATTFSVTGTTGFSSPPPSCNGSGQTLVGNACVQTGSQNVDGFGSFNVTLSGKGGTGDGVSSVTATIDNTSGTWASAVNVLFTNATGASAVSHVSFTTEGCTGFVSNGTTTDTAPTTVCNGGTTTVPEPNSFLLLASGLGLLAFAVRRVGLST